MANNLKLKQKDLRGLKLRETSSPGYLSRKINRLERQLEALSKKLDNDTGVFDTDYDDSRKATD